jgi:hypothetical protein
VGRSGQGSALANPFTVTRNTHANVVKGYRLYLWLVAEKGLSPGEAAQAVKARHPELKLVVSTVWKIPNRNQFLLELTRLLDHLQKTGQLRLKCHCYKTPMLWQGKYHYHCHTEPIASYLCWKLGITFE